MPWPLIAHDRSHGHAAPGPHYHRGLASWVRVHTRVRVGVCARRRSWAERRGWALRVGGKCGLVLQARWGGHGSLTLSPPGSSGPGHRILLVTETRCSPVHGDGCAPGATGAGGRAP